jgi:hypothetical protein
LCRVPLPAFLNTGPSSPALGPNLLGRSRHETAQLARAAIMRGYLNLEPLAWTYLQRQFLCAVREGVMVTNKHGATVKTAIEARPCPSVIARITVTTCVAVVILGAWFFQA